jgi:hypothetical protein
VRRGERDRYASDMEHKLGQFIYQLGRRLQRIAGISDHVQKNACLECRNVHLFDGIYDG